jgi:hypothetical protein
MVDEDKDGKYTLFTGTKTKEVANWTYDTVSIA